MSLKDNPRDQLAALIMASDAFAPIFDVAYRLNYRRGTDPRDARQMFGVAHRGENNSMGDMRHVRRALTTAGLLSLALLPIIGAVSPDAGSTKNAPSRVPVAISQPLAAMDGGPLVAMPASPSSGAMLPESGMLVLVGSALMALAAVVRRTRRNP